MSTLVMRGKPSMTTPSGESEHSGEDLLTVEQAVQVSGLSRATIQRRIRDGRITPVNMRHPGLDRPKAWLLRRADVERLARGETATPPAEG